MPPNSSTSKARLLEAAFAEFAAHGIAGARVNRIAEAARVNKRLIYVYFGSKEQLFETVRAQCLGALAEAVPLHPNYLPGYGHPAPIGRGTVGVLYSTDRSAQCAATSSLQTAHSASLAPVGTAADSRLGAPA